MKNVKNKFHKYEILIRKSLPGRFQIRICEGICPGRFGYQIASGYEQFNYLNKYQFNIPCSNINYSSSIEISLPRNLLKMQLSKL